MADETDPWASDGLTAIHLSFCRPGASGVDSVDTFHPEFLEQFFGQGQSIFGYHDLKIQIRFTTHDLYPNVEISYGEKYQPSKGGTKATNLEKTLGEYLPGYAFEEPAKFDEHVRATAADFTPPGKLVESYTVDGRTYEIRMAELRDPDVQTLIERIQILIPMFIDGGLALNVHDQEWTLDRWRVFFIYEKVPTPPMPTASHYSIVGYATSYRFLTYQPSTSTHFTQDASAFTFPPPEPISIASLPNKSRVSQFLILPHRTKQGHGAKLYGAMVAAFLADPACVEITVEDPNEAFDDLRDVNDYARLVATSPDFAALGLPGASQPGKPMRGSQRLPTTALLGKRRAELEELRHKHKLAPRQFARLVELRLLAGIPLHARKAGAARLTRKLASPDPGDRALYAWRLLVKQRIYRQNRDMLAQLDGGERVEKLEETLEGQARDYERLLEKIERSMDRAKEGGTRTVEVRRGKRKIVDDEDDDDGGEKGAEGQKDAKRLKENGTTGADGSAE